MQPLGPPPSDRLPAGRPPSGRAPAGSSHESPGNRLCAGLQARYEVQAELGRGGMGVVYLARDRQRGQEVALKVLLAANLSEVQRTRFLREGQVTRDLEHPGIVRLLEHGEVDAQPFLAYELIPGARPLDEAAAERRFSDRVLLIRDAARALGYAHRAGVIHRDVKPDNILVGSDGRLRVTDFGLAALEGGQRMTRTGALIGTPHFMSPEQFAGAKMAEVDARTDVWALGVCLYLVASGEFPFQGESLIEIGGAITRASYPLLSEVAAEAPPALDAIVTRALAQDPEQRYPDGEALAEALDLFLDGQTPSPAGAGASKLPLVGLAALTLVVALVALGVAAQRSASASPALPSSSSASSAPATPSPAGEDLEGVRASARAGRLAEATERAAAFESPEGRVLYVELLLEGDRIAEAASATQRVPSAERPRLEALRLLLSARDPREALQALGEPRGPEATLTRSVASFLADPAAQPELAREWFARRVVVDFARSEVARLSAHSREPSVYMTQGVSYQKDLLLARREVLSRAAAEGLWGEHLLARALRAEVQARLHQFLMIHLVIWGNATLLRTEWFEDIQRAIDLQPTGPCARRLERLKYGMQLTMAKRGFEDKVRAALQGCPDDDPRGALFGLDPADRWFQLLLAFVAHPKPERRALAEEVLRLRVPQSDEAGRLRRELCLQLTRVERRLAYEAFLAGDAARGRAAAERAVAAAKKTLEPIKYWKKRKNDSLMKRDREEAGLSFLVAGDFAAAHKNLSRCMDARVKRVYRAEVLMAEGKHREAADVLVAMTQDGKPLPPEVQFQLIHLSLLLGRGDQAREFLAKIRPGVVSERLPWRGTEATRALVEGRGWWPGQGK